MNIFKRFMEFLNWLDRAGLEPNEDESQPVKIKDDIIEFKVHNDNEYNISVVLPESPTPTLPLEKIQEQTIFSYRQAIEAVHGDRIAREGWCTHCPKCGNELPIEDRGRCCGDCRSVIGKIAHVYGLIQYNTNKYYDHTAVSRVINSWSIVDLHINDFLTICADKRLCVHCKSSDYMRNVDFFISHMSMRIGVPYDKMMGIRVNEFAEFLDDIFDGPNAHRSLTTQSDFYNRPLILGCHHSLDKFNDLINKWKI